MIYLSIILISIITYLLVDFVYHEQIYKKYAIYREIPDVGPSIAGYMYKKSADMFSLILSDILHLVKKGYIKLEYGMDKNGEKDYIFSKIKDDFDGLNQCEAIAYNTIFDNDENQVSLNNLANKIKDDVNSSKEARVSGFAMIRSIREQIEEEGIINTSRPSKIFAVLYVILLLIITYIIYKSNIGFINGFELFGTIVIISILIYKTYRNMNEYTDYGKEELSRIHGYVRFLKSYATFKDREIAQIELWEDVYVYAIAFHLPLKGIKEFIGDEVRYNEIKEGVRERLNLLLKKNTSPVVIAIIILYFINPVITALFFGIFVLSIISVYLFINRKG